MARDVAYFKDAIRNGQRFQQQYGGSAAWQTYKDYYRHKWPKGVLPVNQIFSIMRSVVAQTYFRTPSVTITPSKPGLIYQLHALVVQSIDRWLLRELATKYEIKKMIQDAFLTGIGIGFNGYDSEYGWDPSKSEGQTPATLTQFDRKGYRIEYNSFVNPGMPWFLRARPDDVVWPWGTTSANNAEWVALRVLRPIDDLKHDRKYSVPRELKGSHVPYRTGPEGETIHDQYADIVRKDEEWAEVWQIHDAKTGKIHAVNYEVDKFLRSDPDPMQIEGLPVEVLTFNPDPDYIYGIPDARIIEPQLLELNEIRSQAMKHRRVDIAKLAYIKGAIKPDALNKLLDEDVKAAVEIEAEGMDIRQVLMNIAGGSTGVLQDMALCGEQARQDIRESVGFSRNQVGEFMGKTHISAQETKQVSARSDIRVDERRDAVADLLTNIVRKFNQTIFTYWTVPQIQEILGPDGARNWVQFTGPEIKGEYSIRVDPSSSIPLDPESKKQDAIEMAKAWAEMNAGLIANGVPVPAEIQRYFFSQYEGINVEQLLSQQGVRPQAGMQQNPQSIPQLAAGLQAQGVVR